MELKLDTSCGAVLIRPSRASDAGVYRELRLEALWMHPEAFATDHADSAARPLEWWIERVSHGSGEANQVIYVAEAPTGELVGMCGLYREEGVKLQHAANIFGVYVRPAWRGLKIANALMDACEKWARQRGIRLVRLSATTVNNAAVRCYQRRGFVAYGNAPEYIAHNGRYYDELLMAKRLVDAEIENPVD